MLQVPKARIRSGASRIWSFAATRPVHLCIVLNYLLQHTLIYVTIHWFVPSRLDSFHPVCRFDILIDIVPRVDRSVALCGQRQAERHLMFQAVTVARHGVVIMT